MGREAGLLGFRVPRGRSRRLILFALELTRIMRVRSLPLEMVGKCFFLSGEGRGRYLLFRESFFLDAKVKRPVDFLWGVLRDASEAMFFFWDRNLVTFLATDGRLVNPESRGGWLDTQPMFSNNVRLIIKRSLNVFANPFRPGRQTSF